MARLSTVTASAAVEAQRSATAGSAAAIAASVSAKLMAAKPCSRSDTARSVKTTRPRGTCVPAQAQNGRSSRNPTKASPAQGDPRCARRRANQIQAASSDPPARSARRPAKRASSRKRCGRTGGPGRMGRRDSFCPLGANSSGSSSLGTHRNLPPTLCDPGHRISRLSGGGVESVPVRTGALR